MDLDQIRQQYPQYDSMGDQQLADALHQKYYANMPVDQFYQKIGFTPDKSFAQHLIQADKNVATGIEQGTIPKLIQNLTAPAIGITTEVLSGGNPDLQAHLAAQTALHLGVQVPLTNIKAPLTTEYGREWSKAYLTAQDDLQKATDPAAKANIAQRISTLEKSNPYNISNQMAEMDKAVNAFPNIIQGLVTKAQTSLDDFISDPLGSFKSGAKTGVEEAQQIAKHPLESAGSFVGVASDPAYYAGYGEAALAKKALTSFVTDTASATVKLTSINAANAALNLQAKQGYASTDDIVNTISSNLMPMLGMSTVLGGIGLARNAGETSGGTGATGTGVAAENLDTADKIVKHHLDTFKDILTKDDAISAVGNIAQRMNKNPAEPITPVEESKALQDAQDAHLQGAEAPVRTQETTSPVGPTTWKDKLAASYNEFKGPPPRTMEDMGIEPLTTYPEEQEPPEPIKGVTADNFERDAQETALWNKANQTGDPKDLDRARDYSAQVDARVRMAKLQGGSATPAKLAGLALGTAGAIYGYKEGGLGEAFLLGGAGLYSPAMAGFLWRMGKSFISKDDILPGAKTLDGVVQNYRKANAIPNQIASQFRKILTPEQSQRANAAIHGVIPFEDLVGVERDAYRAGRTLFDTYGGALQGRGIIGEVRNDFASRVLVPRDDAPQAVKDNWQKYSTRYSRKLLNGSEGLQQIYDKGLKLKYTQLEDNLAHYISHAQRLIASFDGVKSLLTETPEGEDTPWLMQAKDAPREYKPVAGQRLISSVFRAMKKTQGVENVVPGEFVGHPQLVRYFNNLFDNSQPYAWSRKYDVLNLGLKNSIFNLSLFHAKTLTQHHLMLQKYGIGNFTSLKDVPSIADGTHPIFDEYFNQTPLAQLALKHGANFSPAEDWDNVTSLTDTDEFQKWFDKNIPEGLQPDATNELYGKYKALETGFKRLTFGRLMTGYKLMDTLGMFNDERMRDTLRAQADSSYRIRSDDEIMKGVVTFTNNVYGAQDYWKLMMDSRSEAMRQVKAFVYSPLGRRILQRLMIAPDWFISVNRAMKGAAPMLWQYPKEVFSGNGSIMDRIKGKTVPMETRMHANYIAKTAFYYFLASNMINLMNTGHTIASNKDPLTTEIGGGRTVLLDKAFTDPLKLVRHPVTTMLSKGSPLVEEGVDWASNQEYLTPYGTAPKISREGGPWLEPRLEHMERHGLPIVVQQLFTNPLTGKPGFAPGTALSGALGFPVYSHKEKAVYY